MRKVGLLVAVLSLVTACDEDNPARHLDGGVSDSPAQSDAPVVPQPVVVTVKYDGVGQEGVLVHFQNADSTLVATEMTDATGTASHLLDAGGYVTAVNPFANAPAPSGLPQGPSQDVRTIAGVKPGDHLRIEDGSGGGSGVSMTMTLPPQTDSSIFEYAVQSACGANNVSTITGTGSSGTSPSGLVYFYGCASADVLVTSMDGSGAQLGYFYVPGQPVTMDAVVDYTAKTFGAFATRTYNVGNQPSNLTNFGIEQTIATTKGQLVRYSSSLFGTPATTTAKVPNIPNALSVVEVDGRTPNMQHFAFDWGNFSTNAYNTDFAARMLTDASAISFSTTTHATTWTEASGVAPDFVAVRIFGTRSTTDYRNVEWQIVAPRSGTSVVLPTLPVGTYDLNFASTDGANVDFFVFGKVDGGYDAVRAQYFATDLRANPAGITVGPSGSAQLAIKEFAQLARPTTTATPKKTLLQHRTQSTH